MVQPLKTETLRLPALEFTEGVTCGSILHVIDVAREARVVGIREVKISSRRKADLYLLEGGESIIVTKEKRLEQPAEACGVLRIHDSGEAKWLSHDRLTTLKQRLTVGGWAAERLAARETWSEAFKYQGEVRNANGATIKPGLRPPQIGALHAIAAHWTLFTQAATVVMPTGTGKTETMVAAMVSQVRDTMLVVVPPSVALRNQTIAKFATLGLLRQLGCLPAGVRNPVVGVMTKRPRSEADLEIFQQCNVVIGIINALGQGTAKEFVQEVVDRVGVLVVDEAHHVAAATWASFRSQFESRPILQFTATPYRRDGLLVDGKVIYDYPLGLAQKEGYFKPISFEGLYALDEASADSLIAQKAVEQLRTDLEAGFDHLVLARCRNIDRARAVLALYQTNAANFSPVVVHSDALDSEAQLQRLRDRSSRIVICVDMLGEGFDLPNLKIAAIHDTHKSLAVLLQFTGRFTRVAAGNVGDATVIANIGDQEVSTALERLYSEDADWNKLLREFSSQAVREHAELVEFLDNAKRIDDESDPRATKLSQNLFRPKFSMVSYLADTFNPMNFHTGLPDGTDIRGIWHHERSKTLFFVTLSEPSVEWSRSKDLKDRQWDIFVLHYDEANRLLHLHSSDKGGLHDALARAVGGDSAELVDGEDIFRALGGINRLKLQMVGVRKYGRRNLRYAMYTGADVQNALSVTERGGSTKSNLTGSGWEGGRPVRIGCSLKGRVWSVEAGTIPALIKWFGSMGRKLLDQSIDTSRIIDNVLVPEEIAVFPDAAVLSVEWPVEILQQAEERVLIRWDGGEAALGAFEILADDEPATRTAFHFLVRSDTMTARFVLELGSPDGFRVRQVAGVQIAIQIGRTALALDEYLSQRPPLARFVDMSEVDGNVRYKPNAEQHPAIGDDSFEPWDWSGTDITAESIWTSGGRRPNSVQERVAEHYRSLGFAIIFDDDSKGEAADLVCVKEDGERIRLALVHCKFSGGTDPGARVKDVVEVSAQALRSAKRVRDFKGLCQHLLYRQKNVPRPTGYSRFLCGDATELMRLLRAARQKEVIPEVVIAQPGLSAAARSADQDRVMAAAHAFLKQIVDVDMRVICSA